MDIVRKIVCERDNSQIVPSKPRNELQRLRLSGLYELLVLLRIILTLNLQTGWIHQDEFTNSLEVVAGDYFDLQVFKSSAFNATFPTKSQTLLHMTVYMPYLLCQYVMSYYDELGKESIPNAKLLILIPRLFNVVLSFFVDYLMIKFCELNSNQDPKPEEKEKDTTTVDKDSKINDYSIRLVTLASSQVLLIFASRTHPSSLNLLLFSSLLYLISDSFYKLDKYIPIIDKYYRTKSSENPVEKVLLLRKLKASGYSPIYKLHYITLIIVVGLFNDPDFFLGYACVPLFFYMQRGVSNRYIGMKYFHARFFTFISYLFAFSIPFILWDSFYYGRVTLTDFRTLNLSPENFVVTPVNYFAAKTSAFRDITAYPKIIITYFFLFNILGVMGIVSFFKEIYDIFCSDWRNKPTLDSHWTFLNCSLFLPLFFLIQGNNNSSAFDLVPLIFPLVYMHGHKIPLISRFSSKIGLSWFIFNLIGIIFWGYACQGGIVTSFLDLYTQLVPIRFNQTQVGITFSQMSAIPPTFVLVIPSKWKTLVTAPHVIVDNEEDNMPPNLYKTVLRLESSNKVRVYHTGVSPLPMSHLERDLSRLIYTRDKEESNMHKINFLVIPSSYGRESEEAFKTVKLTHVKTYWNHLFLNLWKDESKGTSMIDFGLSLYRMERVRPKSPNITVTETEFKTIFKFHEMLYDFLGFLADTFTILLTSGLFLMSYLVFLT